MENYLIFKPGIATGETHRAEAIEIDTSGVLILYGLNAAGDKKDVRYAFAPGHWKTVEKIAKNAPMLAGMAKNED